MSNEPRDAARKQAWNDYQLRIGTTPRFAAGAYLHGFNAGWDARGDQTDDIAKGILRMVTSDGVRDAATEQAWIPIRSEADLPNAPDHYLFYLRGFEQDAFQIAFFEPLDLKYWKMKYVAYMHLPPRYQQGENK